MINHKGKHSPLPTTEELEDLVSRASIERELAADKRRQPRNKDHDDHIF